VSRDLLGLPVSEQLCEASLGDSLSVLSEKLINELLNYNELINQVKALCVGTQHSGVFTLHRREIQERESLSILIHSEHTKLDMTD